jgi:hypothetical protein
MMDKANPLECALQEQTSLLVQSLLINTFTGCPPVLANRIANKFAERMLVPRLLLLLRTHPELLDQLYAGSAEA